MKKTNGGVCWGLGNTVRGFISSTFQRKLQQQQPAAGAGGGAGGAKQVQSGRAAASPAPGDRLKKKTSPTVAAAAGGGGQRPLQSRPRASLERRLPRSDKVKKFIIFVRANKKKIEEHLCESLWFFWCVSNL